MKQWLVGLGSALMAGFFGFFLAKKVDTGELDHEDSQTSFSESARPSLSPQPERQTGLQEALRSVDSLTQHLENQLANGSALDRLRILLDLAEAVGPEDAEVVDQVIAQLLISTPMSRQERWLLAMAQGTALGGTEQQEQSPEIEPAAFVAGWASRDLDGLLASWKNMPDDKQGSFGRLIVQALGHLDPDQTLRWLQDLPEKSQNHKSISWIVNAKRKQLLAQREGNEQDLQDLMNWAKTLPENSLKGKVLGQIAFKTSNDNLPQLIETAKSTANDPHAGPLVIRAAEEWAEREPAQAAAWVAQLEDPARQEEAMSKVIREWARRDLKAMGEFLNQMEAGAGRNGGVKAAIPFLATRDPETAAEWAELIDDPVLKTKAQFQIYYYWNQHDQERAEAWSNEVGLDHE